MLSNSSIRPMTLALSRGLDLIWPPRRLEEARDTRLPSTLLRVDDPFSEVVNFDLEHEHVVYRVLISHAALRAYFNADDTDEGPINAYICNASEIAVHAIGRVRTAEAGVIRIEVGDL